MAFCEIKADNWSPFLKDLKGRLSSSNMKVFMNSQQQVFFNNNNEVFKRQVYGTATGEEKWKDLKDKTVEKRERRKTWRGMGASILKETWELHWEIGRHFTTKKTSDGYSASTYLPSSIHKGFGGGKKHTFSQLGGWHQFGTSNMVARPVFSFLLKTRDTLVNNFLKYFWK